VLAGTSWEVIFVDDQSTDGTARRARELGRGDPHVRCLRRLGRRGLAGACIEGMLASGAPYLAVMDADLQHDPRLLGPMLAELKTGRFDVVIGSRYMAGGGADGLSSSRRAASRISGGLAAVLIRVKVSDPMSGFFMIRQEAFEAIAPQLSSEGFKILLDILATARGTLRVTEIPYKFAPRQAGVTKLDLRNVLDFFGLLIAKLSRDIIPVRFVSFLLVGLSGVFVHLAFLRASLLLGAPFTPSQIVATIAAMTSNFFLNNAVTYRDLRLRGLAAVRGLLLFYVICGAGAFSNVGVAGWLYANRPVWWLAGLVGSCVGAVWNFMMSSIVLWRRG
jgi:dolichol-phosphate mannosyltransferase